MNQPRTKRALTAAYAACSALALIVGARPALSATAPAVADRVFTDPTATINVKADQIFLVALAANPSTGYHWKADAPAASSVVAYKGSAYRAVRNGMMGAPGEEIFVYQARGSGDATISLEYLAPGTNAVGKTVRFHVAAAKP